MVSEDEGEVTINLPSMATVLLATLNAILLVTMQAGNVYISIDTGVCMGILLTTTQGSAYMAAYSSQLEHQSIPCKHRPSH